MAKSPLEVGKRSREIVEILYQLGEGSVSEVREKVANPPTYSAVRGILNGLVDKKILKTRQDGKRLLYQPTLAQASAGRGALRKVLESFFGGKPSSLVAALLDESSPEMSAEELQRISRMINEARKQGR